jgi:Ca2+-binding EF-hand superfamily protein
MRILLALLIALALAPAVAAQNQGAVNGIAATPAPVVGGFRFAIQGTNPCTAVHVDFGDGSNNTYTIAGLPDRDTVWHQYTRGGRFVVRATGSAGCSGEASTRVTVDLPTAPPPTTTPTPQPEAPPAATTMRFADMDRNGDHVITRAEWQGSERSFRFHDWNSDGRLSGDEVHPGAMPPATTGRAGLDWSETQFRALDRNADGRISRDEWRGELEDFYRVDRDRNDFLTREEFLISDFDDDRGDRFQDLDLNGDNRVDRKEWHGSENAFRQLDRNNDGSLTADELGIPSAAGRPFSGGAFSRLGAARTVSVSATEAWTDTGLDVRAGDVLRITASGTIGWAPEPGAVAPPAGANGPATDGAPIPRANIGALVGRVGNGRAFLAIASNGTVRVEQSGRLFLGVNDDVLSDNRGSFRVSVTVNR